MSQPPPLRESDLIFPTASTSIKTTLLSLKRSNLSISNRLRSIAADGAFVSKVAATFQLPLVANERCGSWYIDPEVKGGSAYFKSTDGHFGEWSFSLRRLNLGVLEVVGREGGCIIVDSTRRGKSMPDALSKTVGIWIVVLNRLLFDERTDSHELMTPSEVVSDSEHAQIEERLDRFVEEARRLDLNLDELRAKVKKPMRPYWVTPATSLDSLSTPSDDDTFATVVLCTASSKPSMEARNDPDYVQGAADDHEAWSCGLTAPLFWRNSEMLLATAEDELPEKIEAIVALSTNVKDASLPALIKPTASLFLGDESTIEQASSNIDVLVYCGFDVDAAVREGVGSRGGKVIHLPCTSGKNGSRQLRTSLQRLEDLQKIEKLEPKILVAGQDDKDMAVGAALAIVCSFVDESGKLDCVNRQSTINKAEIKKRLSWIIVSKPDAAPSRATLQSVNSYLMG